MNEIKCPHCGEYFTIDESGYSAIVKQIRDKEFSSEIASREAAIKREKEASIQLVKAEGEKELQSKLSQKDSRIQELEAMLKAREQEKKDAIAIALGEKDAIIESLKAKLESSEKEKINAVTVAKTEKDSVINALQAKLESGESDKKNAVAIAVSEKEKELVELRNQLSLKDSEKQLAVAKAEQAKNDEIRAKESKINELNSAMQIKDSQFEIKQNSLKEQYENQLKAKDETIAFYKDFKAKQSTKMIGESLEVYCNNQFELMVHPYLPTAKFGKDNDVVDGTKGDFVFRDVVDGIDSVSIMFEMKNEADDTLIKHKNSDFFKKLDSDRTKKNCEYAVLVSLLELDNDLYNNGIYAVPEYEKMYVVRPQQFLTIISLLVQTGRNTVQVKKELIAAKNRDIDVTHFEERLENFKGIFGKHVKDAATRYNSALEDIDKAIKQLQNMKEDLRLWVDHLYKAENNFEEITIRKLTYKNPTMRAKLEEAREQNRITKIKD